MAGKEDENWKRRRAREDEAEEEESDKVDPQHPLGSQQTGNNEKLLELFQKADLLINQVNNLYMMFFSGKERIPPNERRKELDQLFEVLRKAHKVTAATAFRYNGIQFRYILHRDRWDKLMKDIESGKVKRIMAAKLKGNGKG